MSDKIGKNGKVKTKGKPPSIKELVLSQTGKHDHLLANPDGIRKYYKLDPSCRPSSPIGERRFISHNNMGYNNYKEQMHECAAGYKRYNIITDDDRLEMFLYDTDELGSTGHSSCCTECVKWYIGIDGTDIRCFSIKVYECSDMGGNTRYEDPVQATFTGSFSELLTECPYLITYLDLDNDIEAILKLL